MYVPREVENSRRTPRRESKATEQSFPLFKVILRPLRSTDELRDRACLVKSGSWRLDTVIHKQPAKCVEEVGVFGRMRNIEPEGSAPRDVPTNIESLIYRYAHATTKIEIDTSRRSYPRGNQADQVGFVALNRPLQLSQRRRLPRLDPRLCDRS